jgi:RNA:NAD 2'-phosphotransferase (TPT1/KptA family)
MDITSKYNYYGKSENLSFKEEKDISKAMSSILRHNAKKYGLELRSDGYVSMDEFLKA